MNALSNPTLDPQAGAENTTALLETAEEAKASLKVATGDRKKYPYYRVDPDTGDHIEITRAEYKEYMRKHVTRNYTKLPMCGHKFVPNAEEPRHRNCGSCWFTFFQVHGELTQEVEKAYQEHGPGIIRQTRGPKFLKKFLVFMGTLAQWKKATEEAAALDNKDNNEQSVCGTGSSDSPVSDDGIIASGAD